MNHYEDYDNTTHEYKDIQNRLVGRKVIAVRADWEELWFLFNDATTQGFRVVGDCCSSSYFYDFVGLDKLVANGPILSVEEIGLGDPNDEDSKKGDYVQAYGFKFVSESPEWGDQTSVMSFRNDSNGYYGGWMEPIKKNDMPDLPDRTSDFILNEID